MKYQPPLGDNISWGDIQDFHVHLIEAATPYIQECVQIGRPLQVDDFMTYMDVQRDLAQQEKETMKRELSKENI